MDRAFIILFNRKLASCIGKVILVVEYNSINIVNLYWLRWCLCGDAMNKLKERK